MTEEKKKTPPKPTAQTDAKRVLRRLQGEDGYDIFADRQAHDNRERWQREYEDNQR